MIPFLLVVPCYREAHRVGSFLDDLIRELHPYTESRILLVDDGSGSIHADSTEQIVQSKRATAPGLAPLLRLPKNLGKGATVYAGWDTALPTERLLAFVDADGATPADETRRLLELASSTNASEALFASRIKMLGKNVQRLAFRHLLGRLFATIVTTSLHIPVYDSQCGLKIVPATSYRTIRTQLITRNFAFDVDLLANLLAAGTPVREVPVNWTEIPGGKVHILRDSFLMLREVRRIKLHMRHTHHSPFV